jgi:serine/threonine protein kinase/Tfp pilus assembly protein PilF
MNLSFTSIAPGTLLGRYKIGSLIGAGGMGEVYLAEDTRLERIVALKILPDDLAADQQRMRRFIQEAKSASALNHPNIITIYEIGEAEATHFIATEFIEGETLRSAFSSGPLKLQQAVDISMQVAAALSAAHAAGIVHRDIKPENIMLRRDGYVKVLDFGLAKLTEKATERQFSEPEAMTLVNTEPGIIVGTVSYMSPEQARGQEVDARTDIWSLGVVLYQLITGREPFEAPTATDQIVSILERQPPLISFYMQGIPDELQRIMSRMLAKERDTRYQTAQELLDDLRQFKQRQEFEAELSRSMSLGEKGLAAIVQSGDAASVEEYKKQAVVGQKASKQSRASNVSRRRRSRKVIDSIAVLPLANVSNDPNTEYLSDGITESIINSLSRLPKLRVMARSTVFRYKGRQVDPQEVGSELGVRAVLTGRLLQLGDALMIGAELVDVSDGSHLWGEQYNRKPSDIFAVQEEIAREISDNLQLKLSGEEKQRLVKRYTENTEAYHLYLKGRYFWNKRTHENLEKGTEYFKQAIEADPAYALAYSGLADSYALRGVALPPRDAFPRAIAASRKALEIDDTVAEAHTSLAFARMYFEWDWTGAESEFKRALELNPNYATAYQWYGRYLSAMGRTSESVVNLKTAQKLDPLSLSINTGVGLSHYFGRQYQEAVDYYLKTIEMDQSFTLAHEHLGSAYLQTRMFDEAIAEFQAACRISESDIGLKASLGHAYALMGRTEDAREIIEELIELSRQKYVSPYFVAEMFTGLDEKDRAFEWLEKGYTDRSPHMIFLEVEPKLDTLRSDPRFKDVLRRIGLTA